MRCPRCESENLIKIGHLIYCRDCISFGQIRFNDAPPQYEPINPKAHVYYDLEYTLSKTQQEIADGVLKSIQHKQHVLIQAVCGSGKTELVYPVICDALNHGRRVGFACPRKDLAIELYDRLKSQLKNVDMTLVYGGHHENLYQSLVVLTCHQLHRYWKYFDLLIIDEVDAFPFYNNHLLYQMAASSNKGSFVLLSATAFEEVKLPQNFRRFVLNRRYHDHALPVPKLFWMPDFLTLFVMLYYVKQWILKDSLVLIFVPEKKDLKTIYQFLSVFKIPSEYVSSESKHTSFVLERFRQHHFQVLITTTLLERGVTFENVNVLVFKANHPVFNVSTLIQIAGRVGRKPNYPTGEVYFFSRYVSKAMRLCEKRLKQKNAPYAKKKNTECFKTKEISSV